MSSSSSFNRFVVLWWAQYTKSSSAVCLTNVSFKDAKLKSTSATSWAVDMGRKQAEGRQVVRFDPSKTLARRCWVN